MKAFGESPSSSLVADRQPSSDQQKPIKYLDPDNVYQLENEKEREKNIRYEASSTDQRAIQGMGVLLEKEVMAGF